MITDTSKDSYIEATTFFGSKERSDAIVASEAQGQKELVHSELLPTDISDDDKEVLKAWGVKLGKVCENDALFCEATLPEGWSKETTSHDMHSSVIDEKGRKRISVAYKAAYYDRYASMYPCRRFSIDRDYDHDENFNEIKYDVKADEEILFSFTSAWTGETYKESYSKAESDGSDACREWLEANHPDYNDPVKSWDIVFQSENAKTLIAAQEK